MLKPVHDVLIFSALREALPAVPAAHSCNVDKPWCLRCAKCAYVWVNYLAYLPPAVVTATFGDENLLDVPANQIWFEQMLGLGEHTPFECIGQIDEARLAFELLRRRGVAGMAMERFTDAIQTFDAQATFDRLIEVAVDHHAMPTQIADRVVPVLERLSRSPLPPAG